MKGFEDLWCQAVEGVTKWPKSLDPQQYCPASRFAVLVAGEAGRKPSSVGANLDLALKAGALKGVKRYLGGIHPASWFITRNSAKTFFDAGGYIPQLNPRDLKDRGFSRVWLKVRQPLTNKALLQFLVEEIVQTSGKTRSSIADPILSLVLNEDIQTTVSPESDFLVSKVTAEALWNEFLEKE